MIVFLTDILLGYEADLLPSLAEGYESPWAKQFTIDVVKDKKTDPEIRELELRINHPGLIWTGMYLCHSGFLYFC